MIPEEPLTRQEQYLNRIATGEGTIPEKPITREEMYLDAIAKNGGGGGGGGETITIDPVPTEGSENAVSSGGVYNAIEDVKDSMPDSGTVANAEQLLSDVCTTDTEPYTLRATAGQSDRAYEDAIVGGTVVWNQLIDPVSSVYIKTGLMVSSENGKFTLSGTPNQSGGRLVSWSKNMISLTAQHVYFSLVTLDRTNLNFTATKSGDISSMIDLRQKETIFKASFTAEYVFGANIFENIEYNTSGYWDVFDLTQMFGSTIADYIYSLEQATAGAGVAWFRKYFPADYYPYNTGELISVGGVSEKNAVGFNLWDEEWGNYKYGMNGRVQPTTFLGCKNMVSVIPGNTYSLKVTSVESMPIYVYGYSDTDYNNPTSITASGGFTIPAGVHYVGFAVEKSRYGDTYKNDICFNLSDPVKNGTYEPYTKHAYPLDSTLTLRGIPKLVDGKLSYDGDEYRPDGTVKRRYGIVDLGSLTWTATSTEHVFAGDGLVGAEILNGGVENSLILNNSKYEVSTNQVLASNLGDCKISKAYGSATKVILRDDSYSSVSEFASAVSGTLIYKLGTPTTETAEPYQATQLVYPSGTEEYVTTSIVPVGHSTRYPDNLRKKIEGLPWDFSSLIAPTESTATASRNYTTGSLLIMGNVLYKVTSNIASGSTITPNFNVVATTLSEVISALS